MKGDIIVMYDFEYVPNEEWEPVRDELFEIIHRLQDEVRDEFTFQYHFVGSSKRKMITRDRHSNTGFDFDVNVHFLQGTEQDIALIEINFTKDEMSYNRVYKIS